MGQAVVGNAMIKCSFGTTPSNLSVTPSKVKVGGAPVGTILSSAPNANIAPFGMCTSMANPQVAAATATPPPGVLKPQPCLPMLPGTPWMGCASKVKWSGMPPLTTEGCLTCMWGGQISILQSGQAKVNI